MQFILISDNNVITVLGYGLNEAEVFENGLIKINKNCNFENLDLARYGSDATQAIKYGVKVSGITTHFANKDYDSGEIINQLPIRIEGLTFEQIDKRFVEEAIDISISTLNLLE